MISQEFTKQYKNLNIAQKEAVDATEGAVMVVAGPGTGKTQVLILRIANILLKSQVNPENILALTFTEAAAYEMRKRLLSIIGHDAYRVDITTFHSFCNNFIKHHQEEFAHIIASVSINEIEQLEIIKTCLDSLTLTLLKPLGDLSYYLKPVLSQINELKRENVTPEAFGKAIDDFKKDLDALPDLYHEKGAHKGKMKSIYQKAYKDYEKNKELFKVYSEYQKKLFDNKKYDYNDMLLEVIQKFLEHPYLLQSLQEKFQYFLVDEHQDTNAAQNKIVELLCNYFENPNLFVVGDEKQAIFRFQGANLENFLYFKKMYPHAKLINLSENYRSTQTILDASYELILNNPKSTQILSEMAGLIKKTIHPEKRIELIKLRRADFEYIWIAEKIKDLIKTIPGHEIAVLARNNKDLDPLISVFDSFKIPYIVESDNNVLEDIDVQKLIILLRVIANPLNNHDEYTKKALLFDCFKIAPLDTIKIIRKSYEDKNSVWEILQDDKLLKELKIVSINKIAGFVKFFVDEEEGLIKKASNERFDKVFVDALNKSGLLQKILQKGHSQEILSRITRLYDMVKEEVGKNSLYTVSDFLKHIDLLSENDISLKQNAQILPKSVVRLMTVHKSKGLEFDCVFIINTSDGHWGNSKKRASLFNIPWENLSLRLSKGIEDDSNVDERRLFYVALTRARKSVFLTLSLTSQDGKEQIPSQFVNEIPESYIEEVDVSKFESKLLKQQEKLLGFKNEAKEKIGSLLFSRDYIAELFRRQGLSVSALNNYLECPWKFFFVNLIRIPESIDDAGLFGNAIHGAINRFIISLKKGKSSEDLLFKFFREELSLQSITENERERFENRGIDALKGFYLNRLKFLSKDSESETDIRGIRINEDLILNGKIDLIEPIEHGGFFNITDFKTGKAKSRNQIEGNIKGGDGNYKRQLVFYKILLDRYKNGFFKMKNGIIEFVEPTDKGEYRREIFEITKGEDKALLTQIEKVADEIINLKFWNSKCEEKDCKYCMLREYMSR